MRAWLIAMLAATVAVPGLAQPPTSTTAPLPDEEKTASPAAQRFRQLTEPDSAEAKREREKTKPPYEFTRSQIAPFDILPFVKPGHWNTLSVELIANYDDYSGQLQTSPVRLLDMPHQVQFRREARLVKEQDARLSFQMMLPKPARDMLVELARPEAIRADAVWQASLLRLEPHQMLVPILHADPSAYSPWGRLNAALPSSVDEDTVALERQRYYKLIVPLKPEKPLLSTNPLTWTTISHMIWDGQSPETLNLGQQRALLDWLHFGGQLVIVASGPNVAPLTGSFLGPYLPATPSGGNTSLGAADLEPMARAYPPPLWPGVWKDHVDYNTSGRTMPRYIEPKPIIPAPTRPVLFSGLDPRPGATVIPLDGPGSRPLAVEWRVGRGRVVMLAFNPIDPAFNAEAWPGMDGFVRRVVLRRPEEVQMPSTAGDPFFNFLSGPELTWVRLLGRDLGAVSSASTPEPGDLALPTGPVAAWVDTYPDGLPARAREALEDASGITIPASTFVLKVILAYIVALVPLNWLVCRFVLRRGEWAWAMVPVLALGFAVAVERAAAYDLGYDSACDEIDLLEIQGGHDRAHLSRFAALYTTGRDKYTISYPDDPNALALPLNMGAGRYQRGQDEALSAWQSLPEPALIDFQVQPRSLSMFRAEAMVELKGTIRLLGGDAGSSRQVVNATDLTLHDAIVIDTDTGAVARIGTIAAGAKVEVAGRPAAEPTHRSEIKWLNLTPFLDRLKNHRYNRPEDRGEVRLVAWTDKPHPGQVLTPKVDRHRGFRLVVVRLRHGPPPDPAGRPYFTPGKYFRPRVAPIVPAIEGDEASGDPPPPSNVQRRRRPPPPPPTNMPR